MATGFFRIHRDKYDNGRSQSQVHHRKGGVSYMNQVDGTGRKWDEEYFCPTLLAQYETIH